MNFYIPSQVPFEIFSSSHYSIHKLYAIRYHLTISASDPDSLNWFPVAESRSICRFGSGSRPRLCLLIAYKFLSETKNAIIFFFLNPYKALSLHEKPTGLERALQIGLISQNFPPFGNHFDLPGSGSHPIKSNPKK